MKYTILSTKESELLENLIIKYGQIVTYENILTEASIFWGRQQTKNFITKLIKNGWLIRIKRGFYAISDLSNRGFLSLSPYLVANILIENSYVSFESALAYHGFFDQFTDKIVSVSLKSRKTTPLYGMEYSFIKTKTDYYFGWEEVMIDNKIARIATAEKALVDLVNFHKSKYAIDLVIEKLINYKQELDFARINEYAQKFSITTIKIFGFMFDLLGIDSSLLFNIVNGKRGTHRMLAGAKKFNAKWRLYYDVFFDQYKLPKT